VIAMAGLVMVLTLSIFFTLVWLRRLVFRLPARTMTVRAR
jgi:hypothetical protein